MDKENLLVKGLSELGLTITEEQIEKFAEISQGNLDFTIGSALDLFGGKLSYDEIVEEYNK